MAYSACYHNVKCRPTPSDVAVREYGYELGRSGTPLERRTHVIPRPNHADGSSASPVLVYTNRSKWVELKSSYAEGKADLEQEQEAKKVPAQSSLDSYICSINVSTPDGIDTQDDRLFRFCAGLPLDEVKVRVKKWLSKAFEGFQIEYQLKPQVFPVQVFEDQF